MLQSTTPPQRLAVFIDADNVSAAHAGFIFATARKLGDPIVRRAYGMVNCFSREKGLVECPT